MLTRLKVNGFKNLVNVDVSLGPFTCVAGVNGVGKSNLFDAITFLSALADRPLMEAAKSVRDERNRSTDVRSLFLRVGSEPVGEMSFEAEMLVLEKGQDDLGQEAKAAITFLRYTLALRYRHDEQAPSAERLEITREELGYINVTEARKHLPFQPSPHWRRSTVKGRRFAPFLSTDEKAPNRLIKFHQDGRSGKPREYLAASLPRTVLSSANAAESPTALLARLEMRSWRLLQLEPSCLRNSDSFNAPTHIGTEGSHLAATLHHLARIQARSGTSGDDGESVYVRAANQLAALVEDVCEVRVDEDRQRELLTLQVLDRDKNLHAARALSDGTLRFLALAILEMDPEAQGLLCFEEPENGIHPERIQAMLRLLKDLSVDSDEAVGPDNPLRQVIVNTHSPAVVGLIDDDDLLVAEPREVIVEGKRCRGVGFSWLSGTWRGKAFPNERTVSRGNLGAYLNPLASGEEAEQSATGDAPKKPRARRRVKDRDDLDPLLPFMSQE
jgi:predicted ATPase